MFLRDRNNGDLVEVLDITVLMDPNVDSVAVRSHAGEEKGDPVNIGKALLTFPSGEPLPQCWLDPHYRVSF